MLVWLWSFNIRIMPIRRHSPTSQQAWVSCIIWITFFALFCIITHYPGPLIPCRHSVIQRTCYCSTKQWIPYQLKPASPEWHYGQLCAVRNRIRFQIMWCMTALTTSASDGHSVYDPHLSKCKCCTTVLPTSNHGLMWTLGLYHLPSIYKSLIYTCVTNFSDGLRDYYI